MQREHNDRTANCRWACAAILLAMGIGCSSSSTTDDSSAAPAFQPPESLAIAGDVWQRTSELTAADRRVLTEYLSKHSSLTEGDAVRGEPVVYRQGERRSRFYWFRPEGTGVAWFCLEVQGNRIVPTEGHGTPQ